MDAYLYLYMAKALGADVVLNKPVKSEMMIGAITNLLDAGVMDDSTHLIENQKG